MVFIGAVAFSLGMSLYCSVRSKTKEARRHSLLLIAYMLLPVCGVLIEWFYYRLSWIWPFTAVALMIFFNLQQQIFINERLLRVAKEKEALDARMAMMISQMQPNFLYNALTIIYGLCETDVKKAQRAVVEFSKYLRFNMDSLRQGKPVPFATELSHTEIYIDLEKLRFEERLEVSYKIDTADFLIPSLTVQSIVEELVKCGMKSKEDVCRVSIETRDTDDHIEIIVDTGGVSSGEKHCEGIENVRDRIETTCGGKLLLSETEGGMRATVCLPKCNGI